MNPRQASISALLLSVLCCAGFFSAVRAEDVVYLSTGKPEKGSVTKDQIDGVELTTKQGPVQFTVAQVKKVEFGNDSNEWNRAMNNYNQGQWAAAADDFQGLADSKEAFDNLREVTKADTLLKLGESQFWAGHAKEAVVALERLLKEYPKARLKPKAIDRLAEAYSFLKMQQKVMPLLEQLRALGGDYSARATVYEAQMLLEQGKVDEALKKAEGVTRETTDPETVNRGRVMAANIYIKKGAPDKARSIAEEALKADTTGAFSGAAYLIIGNVLLQEGEASKNKEKLQDAILAYMEVTLKYSDDEGATAEAMCRAGDAFAALFKIGQKPEDRARALAMYSDVQSRFNRSKWAEKSKENQKPLQ